MEDNRSVVDMCSICHENFPNDTVTTTCETVESVMGLIGNGEKYVIYRFLLFIDGFIFKKGVIHGRQSTVEGVYI